MENIKNFLLSQEFYFLSFGIAIMITIFLVLYSIEYKNFKILKAKINKENEEKLFKEKMEKERLERLNKISSINNEQPIYKSSKNDGYSLNTDNTHTLRRRYYSKYNREVTKKDLDFARNNNSYNALEFDLLNWLIINDAIVNDYHRDNERKNDYKDYYNNQDKSDDVYETKEHSSKHNNHSKDDNHSSSYNDHHSSSHHSHSWGGSSSSDSCGGSSGGD